MHASSTHQKFACGCAMRITHNRIAGANDITLPATFFPRNMARGRNPCRGKFRAKLHKLMLAGLIAWPYYPPPNKDKTATQQTQLSKRLAAKLRIYVVKRPLHCIGLSPTTILYGRYRIDTYMKTINTIASANDITLPATASAPK